MSVHFIDWRQMLLLYRHTQEVSQPVWVYFEKPASYLPVGIQRLLHGGFTFLFQKTQISLGFLFNILVIFSVRSHNLPLGILIPFGSLSVDSGASLYGVNLWCQDGPWSPVACFPRALWSSCWLVLCVPKEQEDPVSLCFNVWVLANQMLGFWAFKAFTSVRETAAAFSMFLTDWKVFFQVLCSELLLERLVSVQPTSLASAAVAARNL